MIQNSRLENSNIEAIRNFNRKSFKKLTDSEKLKIKRVKHIRIKSSRAEIA